MIYLAIFYTALLALSYSSITYFMSREASEISAEHSDVNSTTRQFTPSAGNYSSHGKYSDAQSASFETRKEGIEIALIRTCRTITTRAHFTGCTNWDQGTSAWGFAGTVGGVTSIDSISSGTTSATMDVSCSNIADYGRFIFRQQIPTIAYASLGYRVDLTDINNSNSDPCGYDNLVTR